MTVGEGGRSIMNTPPAPTAEASPGASAQESNLGAGQCNTSSSSPNGSEPVELPDICSDSDDLQDPAEYPSWTHSPEVRSRLRLQELGGLQLAKAVFGPVAEVDYYGRGPPSERFSERSSPSPDPSGRHPLVGISSQSHTTNGWN